MSFYPTSFFVWRQIAGAYLYYTVVYNVDGHVVKIINEQPPAGMTSFRQYEEPFTHTVGVVRPAASTEATRLRFYDFTEIACIRLVQLELAGSNWIHREREIPVFEPECIAMLPREMAAAGVKV